MFKWTISPLIHHRVALNYHWRRQCLLLSTLKQTTIPSLLVMLLKNFNVLLWIIAINWQFRYPVLWTCSFVWWLAPSIFVLLYTHATFSLFAHTCWYCTLLFAIRSRTYVVIGNIGVSAVAYDLFVLRKPCKALANKHLISHPCYVYYIFSFDLAFSIGGARRYWNIKRRRLW